jgi:hypothetical protein
MRSTLHVALVRGRIDSGERGREGIEFGGRWRRR